MTKSELKEMIRECLREELSKVNLEEGAFSGGVAGDSSFSGGTVRGVGASTQPSKKNYLDRLKSKNPDLVDTMTVKGKDIKPGMMTQAGQVKEAEVRKNNKGETKVYIMHTNNYDGFWDVDEDMPVMVDPEDKSKPFTGDYKDLLKMGLQEAFEEPIEKLAVVFIGNRSNRKAALDKVTEPRHTIVFSARDFIRHYDNMKYDGLEKGTVKFYADAEGMQELRDVLSEVPARIADPILKNTAVLTEGALTESTLTAEEKVDAWHNGTRRENYKAAGIPKLQTFLDIAKRKGYTEIINILKDELRKRGEPIDDALAVSSEKIEWEDLIEKADELLDELCIESDNVFWDDGDGYWSREVGHEWTMRNLYYTNTLNNIDELRKLCGEYSKKLPNVRFYYNEDDMEEDPVSEIGYEATNVDYEDA